MRAKTFKGGIHPKEYKELSNQCPITPAFPASKTVTIPVTMGGAPNQPVVAVGDEVAKGQIIANGDGFMNCPVHSSISGKVKKIQNFSSRCVRCSRERNLGKNIQTTFCIGYNTYVCSFI